MTDAIKALVRAQDEIAAGNELRYLTRATILAAIRNLEGVASGKDKIVPVEPTREMCEAAPAMPAIHAVNDLPLRKLEWSMSAIQNLKRYRAMLSAVEKKEA